MFKCKICGKKFSTPQGRAAHQRVHKGSAGFRRSDGCAWNKGTKYEETYNKETIDRLKKSQKEGAKKRRGRKLTSQHRAKISKGRSKFLIENPSYHYCRYKSSKSEEYFGLKLKEWCFDFIKQYNDPVWCRAFLVDYYLPRYFIVVEINGNFKYDNDNFLTDYYRRRQDIIEHSGLHVINIDASWVYSINKNQFVDRLINYSGYYGY